MNEEQFYSLKKQISATGYDINRIEQQIKETNNLLKEILNAIKK